MEPALVRAEPTLSSGPSPAQNQAMASVGFDSAQAGRGTGLKGMADRPAAIGGDFEVRTRAGTTVTGTVPVREGEAVR